MRVRQYICSECDSPITVFGKAKPQCACGGMPYVNLTVSFKRYAPFAGTKGHGDSMQFKIPVKPADVKAARKLFAARGALIATVKE